MATAVAVAIVAAAATMVVVATEEHPRYRVVWSVDGGRALTVLSRIYTQRVIIAPSSI